MTNEEINALSDAQINDMVDRFEWRNRAGVIKDFDYCSNISLMMPIVFANGISIIFDGDGMCSAGIMHDMDWEMEIHYSHTNPLRAAAIAYLKMKGVL